MYQKPGMFRTWRDLSKIVFLGLCGGVLLATAFAGCSDHADRLSRLKGRDGLVYQAPTFNYVAPMPNVIPAFGTDESKGIDI